MSDLVLDKWNSETSNPPETKCPMCKDIVECEELADHDGKCKFCWRKGVKVGFTNMAVSKATAGIRLDNHQSRLDK